MKMSKKGIALCLSVFLVCISIAVFAQEKSPNGIVSRCVGDSLTTKSPDGKRAACVDKLGNKWFVVVDGKEEKQFDYLGALVFSPDSKRLAYVAESGKKVFVVVDGKGEKQYDSIGTGTPIFSPDSKRVAYFASSRHQKNWFIVVDGEEGKQYDGYGKIFFSPDSKRIAYMAAEYRFSFYTISSAQNIAVVDGKEGKGYKLMGDIFFSPDSKHVVYCAESMARVPLLVVNGEEKKLKSWPIGGEIIFDSPDSFHYSIKGKDGTSLVEETIK